MSKFKWYKKRTERNNIEVLHWGRRTGKTRELISRIAEDHRAIIVTYSLRMRNYTRSLTDVPGIQNRILDLTDFERHYYGGRSRVYLDEANLIPGPIVERLKENGRLAGLAFSGLTGNNVIMKIAKGTRNYNHKPTPDAIVRALSPGLNMRQLDEMIMNPIQ